MKKHITGFTILTHVCLGLLTGPPTVFDPEHLNALVKAGVATEAVIGADENGVARICAAELQSADSTESNGSGPSNNLLPPGMRSWECIPGVIRNDGIESFRLEVDANGPVIKVTWDGFESVLISQSGSNVLVLNDNGLNGDKVAGDYIYTSETVRYRAQAAMPSYQGLTSNTPAGLNMPYCGKVSVLETNGSTNLFLSPPCVGILNTNIPAVAPVMLSSNIQATDHVLNFATTNHEAQWSLRSGSSLGGLSQRVYQVMPDAFDFLSYFTTDHLEYLPFLTSENFVAGRHFRVRINYSGTGLPTFNNGAAHGSTNRLMGANVFDTTARGINVSSYTAHEYLHQWGAYTAVSLGLTTGDGHFRRTSTADSLLGGIKGIINTNGTLSRDCNWGFGPYVAPPLDKYMMGLIPGASVPPLYVATSVPEVDCDDVVAAFTQVTIQDIQERHGVRSPEPATAKRDFRIGFVATSHNRLLNTTEMTFYEIMAAFYTKALPQEMPAPGLGEGWVPIAKFLGEETTWNSDMLKLIRPTITSHGRTNNAFRITGKGYPGRNYQLLGTTNLLNWISITNRIADANGIYMLDDPRLIASHLGFYRIALPSGQ